MVIAWGFGPQVLFLCSDRVTGQQNLSITFIEGNIFICVSKFIANYLKKLSQLVPYKKKMKNTAKKSPQSITSSNARSLIPKLVEEIEVSFTPELTPERKAKIAAIKAAVKAKTYSPDILKVAESLERELYKDR